jgi:hypothetical protein
MFDLWLQQIDECRPFFVGILGQRYGWVPKTFSDEVASKYGWVQCFAPFVATSPPRD